MRSDDGIADPPLALGLGLLELATVSTGYAPTSFGLTPLVDVLVRATARCAQIVRGERPR